jgi:uncharacterized protein YuzE
MGVIDLFKKFFGSQPGVDRSAYWLEVKCGRCGEIIRTRVDLNNDLSIDYGQDGEVAGYYCRKVLVGEQRCFQSIEATLKFDANRKLVDRQVSGGEFVEA